MKDYQSLSHTRWDCKYHIVFIPKQCKKKLFGGLRRDLGSVLRELAGHKQAEAIDGNLMRDHEHMCLSIPPKYAVLNVVGYIKGKKRYQDCAAAQALISAFEALILKPPAFAGDTY